MFTLRASRYDHHTLFDGAEVLRSMSISSSRIRMIRAYASKIQKFQEVSHTENAHCALISAYPGNSALPSYQSHQRCQRNGEPFCPSPLSLESKFASRLPARTPASTTSITSTVYNHSVEFGISRTGLYRDVLTLRHCMTTLQVLTLRFSPSEFESPVANNLLVIS